VDQFVLVRVLDRFWVYLRVVSQNAKNREGDRRGIGRNLQNSRESVFEENES